MSMVDELNIQISADTGGAGANISNVAQSLESLGGSAENAKGDISDLVSVMSGIAQQMSQFTASVSQAVSGLTSFGSGTADLERFAASSDRASVSLTSMSEAAIYTSPRIGMMGTAAEQTRSELQSMQQGLQGALADIRTFSDNLGSAGKDAADAADKIKKLSDELPKLKTAPVTSLEAAFKKLKATVATLGIGKFLKDSNDAYVVQMQNELKLTAHMKQRMNATDEEIQSIKELASAQQQVGVIGDEIQLAGAQQLTTYAGQASTLKMLIPAMNDLIAQNAGYEASVGDATSAADMLGRALNGQYTSLKRQGIMFTEAQEQVLKYGTESQKAQVLVDAIGDKVGNMNELLANTPTGKLKQLQNDFGDLQEQLGATFQPLISSVLPILRGVMETLAEPILNVSKGITTIGRAIASVDSPAVRGIALAVAGIAVLHKLKMALGGPLTLLLTLGVTLAGLVGSSAEQAEDIGKIVEDAYNSGANAANSATGAVSDFNDELGETQKAVSRLAGFDTITKLSGGGGTGALISGLVGEGDINKLYDITNAASAANEALASLSVPELDFGNMGQNIMEKLFGKDFAENWRTGWNTLSNWWNNDFAPNWKTGANTLSRWWNEEFMPNWQTGINTLKRDWNSFWSNWQTGVNTLMQWWNDDESQRSTVHHSSQDGRHGGGGRYIDIELPTDTAFYVSGHAEPQFPTPAVATNTTTPKTLAQPQNTGIVPSYVPQSQITVNAYINDERVNADYTTINNGSGLSG